MHEVAAWAVKRYGWKLPEPVSPLDRLAKEFSTDEAGRFVNGVLSAVAREVRPGG